jgi:hypothetical protein
MPGARRARTKRWGGPLPEAVTRALDLLRSLGHAGEAAAALDALDPPRKIGRTPPLSPEETAAIAAEFRRRWRRDPGLSVNQVAGLIAKSRGGTLSRVAVWRRIARHCALAGTTVAEWEAGEKTGLTRM